MELAEENCHAESVAGYKGSSARTQIVSEPVTVNCSLIIFSGKWQNLNCVADAEYGE